MDTHEKILASNIECQKAVQNIFTPEFNKRLIKYSIMRINKKFNIKYDLERGFRGIMVEDIISNLMHSFVKLDGGRNWNKSKYPDFKHQIFSALDSFISNTIDKEFKSSFMTDELDESKIQNSNSDEKYNELLNFCLKFLEEIGATDEELLLFEPYIIHNTKRKVIAKEFGITEQEATNIKKRIDRKIPALREQIKNIDNGK